MEEEGLPCNRGDPIGEGGHLWLGQTCELAGNLHVSSSCAMLSQPTMTVLTGSESVERLASRMFGVAGQLATPPQRRCSCSIGGGVQLERIRPRAAIFMPMIPICFSGARGRSSSVKL